MDISIKLYSCLWLSSFENINIIANFIIGVNRRIDGILK